MKAMKSNLINSKFTVVSLYRLGFRNKISSHHGSNATFRNGIAVIEQWESCKGERRYLQKSGRTGCYMNYCFVVKITALNNLKLEIIHFQLLFPVMIKLR